jgi:hypothetical protein
LSDYEVFSGRLLKDREPKKDEALLNKRINKFYKGFARITVLCCYTYDVFTSAKPLVSEQEKIRKSKQAIITLIKTETTPLYNFKRSIYHKY